MIQGNFPEHLIYSEEIKAMGKRFQWKRKCGIKKSTPPIYEIIKMWGSAEQYII